MMKNIIFWVVNSAFAITILAVNAGQNPTYPSMISAILLLIAEVGMFVSISKLDMNTAQTAMKRAVFIALASGVIFAFVHGMSDTNLANVASVFFRLSIVSLPAAIDACGIYAIFEYIALYM